MTLEAYVAGKLRTGMSAKEVKEQLLLVGWSEDIADEALVKGLTQSGVPSPEHTLMAGGRLASTVEIVLNLFSFVLLGGVASALIVLYYQIINNYFPDNLIAGYGYASVSTSAIHYAIAALIVGFPIYYATVKVWFARFRSDEAKVESKLTKWLTYIVLLISAITIVGDLVTAVFYFLQGEISIRFFLKALTILTVFGIIFGFYYLERRKIQYKKDIPRRTFQLFGYTITALVILGIVLGFAAGGSPATERKRGFDQTRSTDLSSLASCIANYGNTNKMLPDSLQSLQENSNYAYCSGKTDPETGAPYSYRIITAKERVESVGVTTRGKFELCASFSLEATSETITQDGYTSPGDKWSIHPSGESCDTEVVILDNSDSSITNPKLTPTVF